MSAVPGVTIVIPLYGGEAELEQCLEAVRSTELDDADRVLLVNDVGPDVDAIERMARRFADHDPRWSYVRNARNMGFVGTCNRAMLELSDPLHDILLLNSDAVPTAGWLDELKAALRENPRASAVSPRSDRAGLSTFPPRTRAPGDTPARDSYQLWLEVAPTVPRWTIAPTVSGFCVLFSRSALSSVGVFDSVFSPGYGEENDLAQRMRQAGHECLLANHAYVHHVGSASFTERRRSALAESHEKILRQRHPSYWSHVVAFTLTGRDRADHFAGLREAAEHPAVIVFCERADSSSRQLWAAAARRAGADVTLCPRVFSAGSADASVVDRGEENRAVWDAAVMVGEDADAEVRRAWAAPRTTHVSAVTDVESAAVALSAALEASPSTSSAHERARTSVAQSPLAWIATPSAARRFARRLARLVRR